MINDGVMDFRIAEVIAQVKMLSIQGKGTISNELRNKIKDKIVKIDEEFGSKIHNICHHEILVDDIEDKNKILISHIEDYAKSDTVWRKVFPAYLKEAESCYIDGHADAAVFFCRLTIETALRDRIFNIKHKKQGIEEAEKDLLDKYPTLGCLIKEAQKLKLCNTNDINGIFSKISYCIIDKNTIEKVGLNWDDISDKLIKGNYAKQIDAGKILIKSKDLIAKIFGNGTFSKLQQCCREGNILNKFIHGDFLWIKDFVEQYKEIHISKDEKITKEFCAYPNVSASFWIIDILKATYDVLRLLYPNNRLKE